MRAPIEYQSTALPCPFLGSVWGVQLGEVARENRSRGVVFFRGRSQPAGVTKRFARKRLRVCVPRGTTASSVAMEDAEACGRKQLVHHFPHTNTRSDLACVRTRPVRTPVASGTSAACRQSMSGVCAAHERGRHVSNTCAACERRASAMPTACQRHVSGGRAARERNASGA